jgi:hypothetical protein
MNIKQLPPLDLRATLNDIARIVFVRAHVTAASGAFVWRDDPNGLPTSEFEADDVVFDFVAILGFDKLRIVTGETVTRMIDDHYADHCIEHDTTQPALAALQEQINSLTADNQVLRELVREGTTVHERGAWIYKAQAVLRD